MPYLETQCMLGDNPSIISSTLKERSKKHLSTLQLKKELKWGDETYLAALIVEPSEGGQQLTSAEVLKVLKEYEHVISQEFFKQLLAQRTVDHAIELLLGVKTRASLPYLMAHLDLAELKKQLSELMDSTYTRDQVLM